MIKQAAILGAALVAIKASGGTSNDVERAIARVTGIFPGADPTSTRDLLRETAWTESYHGEYPGMHLNKADLGPFQINRVGLAGTKDVKSHPALLDKYRTIREKTGIDWPSVQHQDMTNALHGAIAARLVYGNKSAPIPATQAGRADYWKKYYNSSKGKGSASDYTERTRTLGPVVRKKN